MTNPELNILMVGSAWFGSTEMTQVRFWYERPSGHGKCLVDLKPDRTPRTLDYI